MYFTKKEKFYYTLMICFSMEFILAYYNYLFHTEAFLDEAFLLACAEFIPAFIVGVICEWFLVSRVAKKISNYLHCKHFNDHNIIHINELMISIGMVTIISVYGTILHYDGSDTILLFIDNFFKNAIVGIPLFMFFISPLCRKWIYSLRNK